MQKSHVKSHIWELSHVKFQSLITCHMWNFTIGISRVEICHMWNFTCEISHVKFHMWKTCHMRISHVKFHMWNFTCEISHVKFHMWKFTCEISQVKNMSHGKHMGFEIHMCYWNFTCESHVNHVGNTSKFSVRVIISNCRLVPYWRELQVTWSWIRTFLLRTHQSARSERFTDWTTKTDQRCILNLFILV